MDDYLFTRNEFKFKSVTELIEDSGDACGGIQRKLKRPLTVDVRFNDDASTIFDVVGCDRKRAVLVKHTGATTQRKGRCQPKDVEIQLHAHDHTRDQKKYAVLHAYGL